VIAWIMSTIVPPPAQWDLGLIYALLALGVFLTYRILNFADLTVDGSFTTGAGTAAVLITHGAPALAATAAGFAAGCVAGGITAFLHTKLKIEPLLASILTMIALWSINLRIMGKANLPMLNAQTVFTPLRAAGLVDTWVSVPLFIAGAFVFKCLIDWFLATDLGLAVQATGDNPAMASALGVSTDLTKTVTLMVSNGLVGLAGALVGQLQGFADISMGVGLILVGLASVIVGNAIVGTRFMFTASLGVVVGAVLYRFVIYWALASKFLSPQDMKLISAVLVVIALVLSGSRRVRGAFSGLSARRRRDAGPEPMLNLTSAGEDR
jgi:putative ABC transport system permease protein